MHGSLKVVQGIVLLSFVGLMFSSCGGSQTTLSSSDATSGTTVVNPTPTSGTEAIEEEEKNATIPVGYSASNLFVTVPDTIDYLNFTSLYGDWSNRCSMTLSPVPNDITCNIEVNELAIFREGIKFQYNVPANACKYIATYPYWYWNREVGVGPRDIQVTATKNASGTMTSQCIVDNSAPFDCANLAAYPAVAADIRVKVSDEIDVKCLYDTTDQPGGANCCMGSYRLRTILTTPEGSSNSDNDNEWGGSVTECMGGPGRTSWAEKTKGGYPKYNIEIMTPNTARTKIVQIKPTIENSPGSRSNIPISNFFTVGSHDHFGFYTASATASIYPYYVDPVSDRSGDVIDDSEDSIISPGSPFYYFDCLDEAYEVNHRIRVMVQEWDTVAGLQTYISTGVGSADEPGSAPASCPGVTGEKCNQLTDADNFVSTRPSGSYSTASSTNRAKYFPNHDYE